MIWEHQLYGFRQNDLNRFRRNWRYKNKLNTNRYGNLSLWESHFIAKVLLLSQIISFLVGKSVSLNDLSYVYYRCCLYRFLYVLEPDTTTIIVIDWMLATLISWDSHNERTPIAFFCNIVNWLIFIAFYYNVSKKRVPLQLWNETLFLC